MMEPDSTERADGGAHAACDRCTPRFDALERRTVRQKLARQAAENLLEEKSLALFQANQRLEQLNDVLESRVLERTQELEAERERAVELSRQDHLTKLANRAVLAEEMGNLAASNRAFTLVLMDLDGFKQINDTHGHAAGDTVLCAVASRLRDTVPDPALVARLGGDEFAVLLPDTKGFSDAESLMERLLSAIGAPIRSGESTLICGASIGCANFPDQADSVQDLQIHADLALYQAKTSNGSKAVLFFPELAQLHRERKILARDLHRALDDRSLTTFYQPIIAYGDRREVSCEVLLRWNHPDRGWISPVDIISIGEETGQVGHITRFVISHAFEELAPLLRSGALNTMTINLIDRDLRDDDLTRFILDQSVIHGVAPKRVKFEITEHSVVTDAQAARETMTNLEDHGFSFAIDDFGTGYSNLRTLHQLPFRVLKIDRGFISSLFSDKDSRTIVKAMIDLAHGLRLRVVAEGIETLQESETLRAMGCDYGQGYLFGRAQPLAQFNTFLSGYQRSYGTLLADTPDLYKLTG